ncbi:MAG: hypothetical protein F4Y47_00955 [Acidobacteriia bacterium]|nr:hypothetical protein [Terriglobia bacterium]MYG01347.1 hypothetical protein [Terriglobia bacterium]MYK09929.1 hypothetical protein [Terriglobia bacterium]
MKRRAAVGWGLGIVVALWLVGVVSPQEAEPPPEATITELMQAMVIPASTKLFDVPRNVPQDDSGWAEVRNSAVLLAESGTLLIRDGRAKDSDVWAATSRALAEAGEAALKAARARDPEAIGEAGNLLIDACERCHEKHWIR